MHDVHKYGRAGYVVYIRRHSRRIITIRIQDQYTCVSHLRHRLHTAANTARVKLQP